ncbi:uncharacterized protein LOC133930281 [Phragmites australis]|uniref:uncharacterized protein LOC133930281 n=1 Tax=Phragmites australis TaxID=29695 RepID=UPI002D7972EC|nr:uncharacterized protein LOC133930281 [Phragmites australis]
MGQPLQQRQRPGATVLQREVQQDPPRKTEEVLKRRQDPLRQGDKGQQEALGKKTCDTHPTAQGKVAGHQICAAEQSEFVEEYRVGDPGYRPARGRCVLSWTRGMERNERWLGEHALLASVLMGRPPVSPGELLEAIEHSTGVLARDVRVEVTRTEDFLVSFRNTRDKNAVFRRSHELLCNDVPISFKLWSRRSWATSSELMFFTKIAFDGLPVHAWEEEAMHKLVNVLGGRLVALVPADDARCLEAFAWFKDPAGLPHRYDVEIPERAGAAGSWRESSSSALPPAPRRVPTLVYPVIIHVEEVIDPTPLHIARRLHDDHDGDVVPRRNAFSCWVGRYDGSGPWGTEQGGGHVFGGASGSAGGLDRHSHRSLPGAEDREQESLQGGARGTVVETATRETRSGFAASAQPGKQPDDLALVLATQFHGAATWEVGLASAKAADRPEDLACQGAATSMALPATETAWGGVWFSPQAATARTTTLAAEYVDDAMFQEDPVAGLDFQELRTKLTGGELTEEEQAGGGGRDGRVREGAFAPAERRLTQESVDAVLVDQLEFARPEVAATLTRPATAPDLCRPGLPRDAVATVAKKLPFADQPQDSRPTAEEERAATALKAKEHAAPGTVPSGALGGSSASKSPAGGLIVYGRRPNKTVPKRPSRVEAQANVDSHDQASETGPASFTLGLTQAEAHQNATSQETVVEAAQQRALVTPSTPAPEIQDFIQSISLSPPASILGRPPPASMLATRSWRRNTIPADFTPWRSPRISLQGSGAHKHVISKAQKVIMKKLGIVEEEEEAEQEAVRRFIGLFDHPLSPQHLEAMASLLDVDISPRAQQLPEELARAAAAPIASPA